MVNEELLQRVRRSLNMGMSWFVDPIYAKRPDYGATLAALEAEGYSVQRGVSEVRVDPTNRKEDHGCK